ncbi:pentatricopeptide repeat-containing protein, partial [Trifolium medium]|nr:pentatricopeptide repeat-containing protein [Trifolium medium]
MLDCICKICREKDPFKLHSESSKVLVEMDQHGVPRNVETFNAARLEEGDVMIDGMKSSG